ncbi:MAG: type I restriction endonuclease subunit R [Fusobacteriaceae bacterium]|nr:type I restriction endonuclease subunit R [Fusobacteriaceae bacterium]
MSNLNEDAVEYSLIEILLGEGYTYYHDTTIAPNGDLPKREKLSDVILDDELKEALLRLNPNAPKSALDEAYQHIIHLGSSDIMTNNEKFHKFLTDGITVEHFKDGNTKGMQIKVIDFEEGKTLNNTFTVVNQFKIKENNSSKRLDVILFVNGLPLVVVELKNALDEKATLEKAYTQIQNYKTAIPTIFYYNALCVISDGLDARTSSVSAPFSRYLAWKSPKKEENGKVPELQIMAQEMLKPEVLLKLIRFNTIFESEEVKNKKTGLVQMVKIKKIAAYHQYYMVEKAVKETLRATHTKGDRRIGVVWHTQGSGKSLSMVFYSGQLVVNPQMENPTLVILTDRNDLDEQLFGTFGNCSSLLRQTPKQATSREELKELLNISGGGIIFTTIQKFYPEDGKEVYEEINARNNIVVIADEAHRSQYGFSGRIDEKTGQIKYGNAKHLRDALPNASFIGFTGTPIEKEDRDTTKVFGDYIDIYDISQAVEDGATVPLSYEARLVKIKYDKKFEEYVDEEVDNIEGATEEQIEKAKSRIAQINTIVGHPDRLKEIANNIVTHFEKRQEVFEGKAMVVCMTRQIAIDLYDQIIALKPDWHNTDLNKGVIKVVMTSTSSDPEEFQPHNTNKQQRKELATRLKNPLDELKLVIVQSMWLTGFDAPPLHTLYIDKKMQGAALMQAIARVNRVYKDKPGGLIVDFIGIGQDLRNAMGFYTSSGGKGEAVADIEKIITELHTKFEVVKQMFNGFDYSGYFTNSTKDKLAIILGAQNFILADEKLKDRFLKETSALSKLYAMAIPNPEALELKDEIAFFQAIKSRLMKFTPQGGKTDYQVESAIKQIVEDALSSDGVIDIFEAAGLAKPSLDILSDEFMLEVKNMKHKNLALELLKKLLNDEIRIRKTKSIVQGKKFSEMMSNTIQRYHNQQIDAAQVLEELANMAKEMKLEDGEASKLGLSPEEYAFYTVLAQNESTKALDDHKMKELIHTITDIVRKTVKTTDWNKRDDVRASLRLLVKKILMRYGYPPDLARMEADRVLAQSELFASELSEND